MRPLCLLPLGAVLHREFVPLLAGGVRAVVLSLVLAGHRPVEGEQPVRGGDVALRYHGKLPAKEYWSSGRAMIHLR